jgi:hypothetical protein
MVEEMRRAVEGLEAEGSRAVATQEHSVEQGGNLLAAQLAHSARICSYRLYSRLK